MMTKEITTTLRNCARCGSGHGLTFQPFKQFVIDSESGEVRYTHWAMCPLSDEPILMRVVDEPE